MARTSFTSVAAAHGYSGWPPHARVNSPTPPPDGAVASPLKTNPSAPLRGPSLLRMQMLRPDPAAAAAAAGPPLPALPLSPRTSDTSSSGQPVAPVKRPSWPRSEASEAAQKQEEATYRLTLSGPKLKSHRVRLPGALLPLMRATRSPTTL